MMGSEGISVADALALRNSDGNNGFGGDNGWWIVLLILLFAGGRGFGWGNGGNGGDGFNGYTACCTPATHQGVTDAFNFNQLDNGIRGLERGICDGFYSTAQGINAVTSAVQNCCCDTKSALCAGFNGVNQSIANLGYNMGQGFCGVDKSILQSDFHVQAGFNALGNQLASCCCDLERGQEAIKCALEKATGDILISNERNTNQIVSYLTQTEMDKLRTELQSAQFQLSQLSQTSNIVEQLMPVAKPAYITCSPYAAAFGYGFQNNGCGCNSCC
jgi:hypothetical protein